MKTEEQIKEEIRKYKKNLEHTNFKNRTVEQKMHSAIIEALEWVIKADKKEELINTTTNDND